MLLHNMKIRSKLFIAFGLFIVLMIVSSGLSLFSLDRTNTSMQNIITHDYPTTVKANLLIDNFQDFVSTQQLMLLDESYAEARSRKSSWMRLASALRYCDVLSASRQDEASKAIIAGIRDVRQQYLASRFRYFAGNSEP